MRTLLHLAIATCLGLAATAQAQSLARVPAPTYQSPIQLSAERAKVDPSLWQAKLPVAVVIRLTNAPLAVAVGKDARRKGAKLSASAQRAYVAKLTAQQDPVAALVTAAGGTVHGRLTKVLNGVIALVPPSALPALARMGAVATIRPIADYELDLSETVPYIGAAAVQNAGFDGTGVRVAVLDSGIDYTHSHFGGPGTLAAYESAYGTDPSDPRNTTLDGLFPTAKVAGGYDFVGEGWPTTDLAPDPDPIDFESHGTHVADIIGGLNGVAPGASLYSFKVCSAVSTSCSGIAILLGLDAALDPDGNGDITDAVDVINMSIGLGYGMIQDDSAAAVQNAVDMGVVVVVSAGNSGDKPYVAGSPSIAPGAISVAQTQVPSAKAFKLGIQQDGGSINYILNTASVEWAPVEGDVSGPVAVVGIACGALTPGSLAGKVALVDRGSCAISLKVDNAAQAGAVAVIVANNVPGDPPSFSFGGGSLMVPTLIISQAAGNALKSAAQSHSLVAYFSENLFTPLVGSMASTSSRGPSSSNQQIKPDIGAPGASVSAEVGTGTGVSAFGGTSGAAPMVAGSAALVLDAYPALVPSEVKARLMNNAEKNIYINPVSQPGVLAPITRIGAGEVRVGPAITTKHIAYERTTKIPSLSFGYLAINSATAVTSYKRWIEVRNLGTTPCTYTPANAFRYADDAASGAVAVSFSPASITVAPGAKGALCMTLKITGANLPDWESYLDGGPRGGSGEGLRALEYDGYVQLACGTEGTLSLPWQVLPRKAADVRPDATTVQLTGDPASGTLTLKNKYGSREGTTELFDLLGTSPLDYPFPAPPGANYALVDLRSFGARYFESGGAHYVQFAVATHGEPAQSIYPAGVEIDIDTTGDGETDYAIYKKENVAFAGSGQNLTVVYNVAAGTEQIFFYTDSDFNAGVQVFTVRLDQLGMTGPGEPMNILVLAYDNYFTGWVTDEITDGPFLILYTPGVPKFYADTLDVSVSVPPGGTTALPLQHSPDGDYYSPSQTGLMLFNRQAAPKRWADEVRLLLP